VRLLAGTSGYAFKEWKGSFYPSDLKNDAMLGYYASRFPAVEINNTFYRLPRENVIAEWAVQVPETFTFAIKASQRITHFARLKPECESAVNFLLTNAAGLGGKLGPILFQLPPNLKKDLDRLRVFLDMLPFDRRFTVEFRHESWFDGDVFDTLRSRDVALCVSEQSEIAAPIVATASWGYCRLHRPDYTASDLADWARKVAGQSWSDAYVFFKHDHEAGSGPPAVETFTRAFAESTPH
jgi:uncharacterized protein YecE (DUF72 family)